VLPVGWVLLWLLLIVGAAVFLTLLVRRVWRQAKALAAELSRASDRLNEASPSSAIDLHR